MAFSRRYNTCGISDGNLALVVNVEKQIHFIRYFGDIFGLRRIHLTQNKHKGDIQTFNKSELKFWDNFFDNGKS